MVPSKVKLLHSPTYLQVCSREAFGGGCYLEEGGFAARLSLMKLDGSRETLHDGESVRLLMKKIHKIHIHFVTRRLVPAFLAGSLY